MKPFHVYSTCDCHSCTVGAFLTSRSSIVSCHFRVNASVRRGVSSRGLTCTATLRVLVCPERAAQDRDSADPLAFVEREIPPEIRRYIGNERKLREAEEELDKVWARSRKAQQEQDMLVSAGVLACVRCSAGLTLRPTASLRPPSLSLPLSPSLPSRSRSRSRSLVSISPSLPPSHTHALVLYWCCCCHRALSASRSSRS
jgi:hypothetical protein